jgi:hypothetical protein
VPGGTTGHRKVTYVPSRNMMIINNRFVFRMFANNIGLLEASTKTRHKYKEVQKKRIKKRNNPTKITQRNCIFYRNRIPLQNIKKLKCC